jgi:Protein of unknown function (DUF5663)
MFNFKFDHEAVLRRLGLENASPAVQTQVLDKIYAQLETMMRVRLSAEMNEDDHKIFARLVDSDGDQAKLWLETRFPNYEQMYSEELEDLVSELKRHADAVVDTGKDISKG